MNKFCVKVAALCLSAAMFTSAFAVPSLWNAGTVADVVSAATEEEPVELLKNTDFESGTKKWATYTASGGSAKISAEDGKLALKVATVGKLNYGVQLYYDILPMYQNGVYRFRFDISSDIDRKVEAMVQQNGGKYQSYVWKGLELTSEPQTVDITFTMKAETDQFARMVFNCGNPEEGGPELGEHTIYLDNVHLELIDDSKVDYTGFIVEEEKIITNQIGYLPDMAKTAVFRGSAEEVGKEFYVVNSETKKTVYTGEITGGVENASADEVDWYGDFSEVKEAGKYYITTDVITDPSYEFSIGEDVYDKAFDASVYMLYLQRCGCEVADKDYGHDVCHASEAVIYKTDEKIDVTGGWHDAGDYGRYIVPAAKTVADLLIAYEKNPELFGDDLGIPESGNKIPDVLDEVRYELEWMLKMQNKETGGVYHKVSCENFPGYVLPEKEKDTLIVTPVSTTATADFCASMAMAYEWYKDIDKEFADKCLVAAESAWGFLEKNPDLIFANPKDIKTGDYGDKSDVDERYWAAAQMYRATGDTKYEEAFLSYAGTKGKSGLDWSTVGAYGNIAYLTMDKELQHEEAYEVAKSALLKEAATALKTAETTPYGVAISSYAWGSNMTIANCGMILQTAAMIDDSADYKKAANEQLNYLFGKNPCGTSFLTGYGTVSPVAPHHRPSMALEKCVPGMLVGGVNSNLEDPAALGLLEDAPPAKCFIDNAESYSTNEITIYWNSPLVALLAGVLTDDAPSVEPGPSEPGDKEGTYGDLDNNDKVELTDLTLLSLHLIGDSLLGEDVLKYADVNASGKVDIADLAHFKQYLSKDETVVLGPVAE